MKLNWKTLRMAFLATATGLMVTGCGGITASPSISPLTFLLPGFVQNKPVEEKADPEQALPPVDALQGSTSVAISQ